MTSGYRVIVADNYDYMAEDARYELPPFDDLASAEQACRKIVDDFLVKALKPGMSAEALLREYRMFGEDPFIIAPGSEEVEFSAWDYAKERCEALVSGGGPGAL